MQNPKQSNNNYTVRHSAQKTRKSRSLAFQSTILEILERFLGFYSEKFKFCDLLNHWTKKLVLRKNLR